MTPCPDHPLTTYRPGLFAGRNAVVAGGTSGINLGIAKAIAACGAKVAVIGRNGEKAEHAASALREIGPEALPLIADVRDFAAIDAAMAQAAKRFGPLDFVVAGAAGNFIAAADSLSSNGFRTVTDIDLLGAFHTFKTARPWLREEGSSLIAISSGQAFQPMWGQVHASAAKAGIESLVRTLALEWGPAGIRVNSLSPGPIAATEGVKRLVPQSRVDAIARRLPIRRFGSAEEVGNAAVFLLSPAASFVTGMTLFCDGGMMLTPYDGQPGADLVPETVR
ncbi:SDR family oxidoreductase [Sphingomonas sp.]|uniref:SDR family oxidoreductase n=1 Tax=Sphingomonas sp. TaxID=28214 RepID=UPI0025E9ADDB|nr:SDR family oxidoreductase [Sphingomonas sp.]